MAIDLRVAKLTNVSVGSNTMNISSEVVRNRRTSCASAMKPFKSRNVANAARKLKAVRA